MSGAFCSYPPPDSTSPKPYQSVWMFPSINTSLERFPKPHYCINLFVACESWGAPSIIDASLSHMIGPEIYPLIGHEFQKTGIMDNALPNQVNSVRHALHHAFMFLPSARNAMRTPPTASAHRAGANHFADL